MVELISVHIPKSAGTSFRKVLQRHYGRRLLVLYGGFGSEGYFQSRLDKHPGTLALHGHFPLKLFRHSYPQAKKIIWLRHPVDRIISYYYFWKKLRPHGNPNHKRFLIEKPSLVHFAEERCTELADYLDENNILDMDFIGIVENFDEDVQRFENWFAGCIGQRKPDMLFNLYSRIFMRDRKHIPRANRTRRKPQVSTDLRERLEEILQYEMAIYRQALTLTRR